MYMKPAKRVENVLITKKKMQWCDVMQVLDKTPWYSYCNICVSSQHTCWHLYQYTCINTTHLYQVYIYKCIYQVTLDIYKLHCIYHKVWGQKKKFRLPSDFSTSMESKTTVKHHCLEPKGERLCENCAILSQILSILQVLRL